MNQNNKQLPTLIKTAYLRRILTEETFYINPTDGTRIIAEANDVFAADIDVYFKLLGLTNVSQSTGMTNAIVYELIADGSFMNIFGSFGNIDNSCLTQDQIIDFADENKRILRQNGYSTFLLFKKDDSILSEDDPDNKNLFIADVRVYSSDRLRVDARPFSLARKWNAECRDRFVIPQRIV